MGRLLQDLTGSRRQQNLRLGEIIDRQRRIENARRKVFRGVQAKQYYTEDQLQEKNNEFKDSQNAKSDLENQLSKYILIHCAKTELSLIDLGSGKTFPNENEEEDLMSIILR